MTVQNLIAQHHNLMQKINKQIKIVRSILIATADENKTISICVFR